MSRQRAQGVTTIVNTGAAGRSHGRGRRCSEGRMAEIVRRQHLVPKCSSWLCGPSFMRCTMDVYTSHDVSGDVSARRHATACRCDMTAGSCKTVI